MAEPADLLDAFQPVGPPRDKPHRTAPGTSAIQRRQTTPVSPDAINPHVALDLERKMLANSRSTTLKTTVATLDEQQRLATRILRRFGKRALDDGISASAQKNFAAAWGIASDKLTILQGRPTQIVRHEEAETQRPAILELALKLARVAEQRALPANSDQQNAARDERPSGSGEAT